MAPDLWLLFMHIIGASIWTGGHLILSLGVLPQALGARDPARLLAFETVYEKIALPAMGVQILSGSWLAFRLAPDPSTWLDVSNPITRAIFLKLALLTASVVLALHARLVLIPQLDARRLPPRGPCRRRHLYRHCFRLDRAVVPPWRDRLTVGLLGSRSSFLSDRRFRATDLPSLQSIDHCATFGGAWRRRAQKMINTFAIAAWFASLKLQSKPSFERALCRRLPIFGIAPNEPVGADQWSLCARILILYEF